MNCFMKSFIELNLFADKKKTNCDKIEDAINKH